MRAAVSSTNGRLRGSGSRSPIVSVRGKPCWAGYWPEKSVARLGVHMHVLQNACVKLSPVRASSASFGISSRIHPGSSGQCCG